MFVSASYATGFRPMRLTFGKLVVKVFGFRARRGCVSRLLQYEKYYSGVKYRVKERFWLFKVYKVKR